METEVLTSKAAAEFLSIHEKTLIKKARAGVIPAAKIGREWRFSRRQLVEWIEAGGVLPEPDVDRWLVEVSEERAATTAPEHLIPIEQVKAEMGR